MAPLIKNELFHFTPFIEHNFLISLLNYSLGILGNTVLLFLWWQHRNTDNDRYSVIVIGTDLLAVFSFIAEAMAYSLQGFNDNSLGFGAYYCIAIGIVSFANCFTNLFCVTLYAYQRYRIIFKQSPLSLRLCFIVIAIYYIFAILVPTSPLLFGEFFIYRLAGTYCLYDWNDTSPYMMMIDLIVLLMVAFYVSSLTIMYYKIFVYNCKIAKEIQQNATAVEEVPEYEKSLKISVIAENQFQKRLFRRVIIIVGVCFLCYSPFVLGVVYEILSANRVSQLYDSVASGLVVANSLGDFLVFITTNSSYRRTFWGLFGLHFDN